MNASEGKLPEFKPLDLLKPERPTKNLATKEHWHNTVRKKVARAPKSGRPLSVILLDVNHYKDVNDVHGHDAGDTLAEHMEAMVGLINDSLRTKNRKTLGLKRRNRRRNPGILDMVAVSPTRSPRGRTGFSDIDSLAARIGGDEYAILCETDEAGAKVVAGRLRSTFGEFLERPDAQPLSEIGVGVAIGIGTLKPGMNARDLLVEADRAMYQDKVSQLDLSMAQQEWLIGVFEGLEERNLRYRDMGKYAMILANKGAVVSAKDPSSP